MATVKLEVREEQWFWVFETGSLVAQAGLEISMQLKMALNFGSSFLRLQSAGILVYTITSGLCGAGMVHTEPCAC